MTAFPSIFRVSAGDFAAPTDGAYVPVPSPHSGPQTISRDVTTDVECRALAAGSTGSPNITTLLTPDWCEVDYWAASGIPLADGKPYQLTWIDGTFISRTIAQDGSTTIERQTKPDGSSFVMFPTSGHNVVESVDAAGTRAQAITLLSNGHPDDLGTYPATYGTYPSGHVQSYGRMDDNNYADGITGTWSDDGSPIYVSRWKNGVTDGGSALWYQGVPYYVAYMSGGVQYRADDPTKPSLLVYGPVLDGTIDMVTATWTDATGATSRADGPAVAVYKLDNPDDHSGDQWWLHGTQYPDKASWVTAGGRA